MKTKLSFSQELTTNLEAIRNIDKCVKITLGPTGKNGIFYNQKGEIKFLTSGAILVKALDFSKISSNLLLKLIEQASTKTQLISGDGSTITLLLTCNLLKTSFLFLANDYNPLILSKGLQKLSNFCYEQILQSSQPILQNDHLKGIIQTSLGKKISFELKELLYTTISKIERDGLILIEENVIKDNEIEIVQGIELDKGFASSYFVNNLKTFEVIYDQPYLLIAKDSINSLSQLEEILDYIQKTKRSFVLIAEEITKEIISKLVLLNIKKKVNIAVIKYTSIKFLKTGILEDLSLLTYSNSFSSILKNTTRRYSISDLGQAEKVIIRKEKSTFFVSKFSKLLVQRRINELNRELLLSETEHEKNLCKLRIARLSGNIVKFKLKASNQYQLQEERQKIENLFSTIRSSLEEGILPGGGIYYLYLSEEIKNWSYLNLIGDEIFSAQILGKILLRPFQELCKNTNLNSYSIFKNLKKLGYPYAFDVTRKEFLHSLTEGLIDSAKAIRGSLWNSLTISATILTSIDDY